MYVEAVPKRRLYPILGFFVALGAPAGLLILKGVVEQTLFDREWIRAEVASHALTYGYVAVSTAVLFVGLGYILGANEDLLQRVSLTDSLTGLANRRLLDRRLREELARVDRYKNSLSLMLLDLDGLKNLNDRKGHEAGDNAIRAVARTLQKTCRSTDVAARFGGDEFAVLAPNVTALEARTLAERVRRSLGMEASWVAVDLPPLTLSIGIADLSSISELHPDRLYSAADRALYGAKHGGKDRVVLATPELEPTEEAASSSSF
jgi:diguanylate cyclase (GGDEF)-like protein